MKDVIKDGPYFNRREDKFCFVYCGDDYCNCKAGEKMSNYSSGLFQDPRASTPNTPANKIEVDVKDDFGFSTVSPPLNGSITEENVNRAMTRVYAFLDKLAENPDKDIHWPNRDQRIQIFKKELQNILHGKA